LKEALVRVVTYDWVWNLKRQGNTSSYQYIRQERDVREDRVSLAQSKAHYRFIPSEYGEYRIFVEEVVSKMRTSLPVSTYHGMGTHGEGAREYLELEADRKLYTPGMNAHIHIRSPFDGMVMVCIEREKVLAWQVVPVTGKAARVSFLIEPQYLPNVYCTATVVRTVAQAKEPLHRVYGVVPLTIEVDRQLTLAITAPKKVRPQNSVDVEISVKRNGVCIPQAFVTLAAVDEGICQVTHFETPSPFAFFYGKESLQTRSLDVYEQLLPESPPGGKTFTSPATRPMSVRLSQTVAIWNSGLYTNAEGKVRATLYIPSYLGEIRLMAVAVKDDCFGSAESPMTVSQPAILQISSPRFAAWGDEFTVTASVINQTGQKRKAELQLTCDSLEVQNRSVQTKELEDRQEAIFPFHIRCPHGYREAKLHFRGFLGSEVLQNSFSLPLRPSIPPLEQSECGVFSLGQNHLLKIPGKWHPCTGKITLILSSRPEVRFSSSLDYLLRYPYGCVEQTTSKSFPLLYMEDLLSLVEQGTEKKSAADYVKAGIRRLSLMQTPSGGLSMWPGGDETYPWGTVYASHFLVEAKKAGYEVSQALLEGVMEYLKTSLHRPCHTAQDREIRAYSSFVLAYTGKLSSADISMVMHRASQMSNIERCFMAATLAILGQKTTAERLLAEKLPEPGIGRARETGGNLHSPVRDSAILMATLLQINPDDPNMAKLASQIVGSSYSGRWSNTQENAYALMALGKYGAKLRTTQPAYLQGTVREKGKTLLSFNQPQEVTLVLSRDEEASLEISIMGTGKIFYRWVASGIPLLDLNTPISQGIQIIRRILSSEGKEISEGKIRQGDLVWVELSLRAQEAYQNIVLEALLPAGFEAENPRLANTARLEIESRCSLKPQYIEIRDDRLEFFLSLSHRQPGTLMYAMRAIAPGIFRLPGVVGKCMYDPSIQARSTSMVIVVE
jgi:uncharacterized protein YfaS (alpha-2-macroglobulin family)